VEDAWGAGHQKYSNGKFRGKLFGATKEITVTCDSVMRVRKDLNPIVREAQGEAVILFGAKSVTFPLFAKPHLEKIANSPTISAISLPTDIDIEGRLNILSSLKREGLLEIT